MAWVTEYDMTWRSGNALGKIEIQRDGGSYQQGLTLKRESLQIRQILPDWDSQIFRMSCSFTIINDLSDYFELLPLMTISAGQLKVVVTETSPSSITLFEGYMNPEIVSQSIFAKAPIRLTASGLLSKLAYDNPLSVDTIQNRSLIDLLDDCLRLTGSEYDILVRCTIAEAGASLSGNQTAFNRTAVSTEAFWENNIERKSALEIISDMLASFNCYLYWYRGFWWIESYEDLDWYPSSTKAYVRYTTGTSAGYGWYDTGAYYATTPSLSPQVHDPNNKPQHHPKQTLSVIPGARRIDIQLNQMSFFNFFNSDMIDTVLSPSQEPTPALREWHAFDVTGAIAWDKAGHSYDIISNGIHRDGSYSGATGQGFKNGLTTRFRITARVDTSLTINFKFSTNFAAIIPIPSEYIVRFYWYLRTNSGDYFDQGESSGDWNLVPGGDPAVNYNVLEVSANSFSESYPNSYEGAITIPIGDIIGTSDDFSEDMDLIFRMGTEEHQVIDEPSTADPFYLTAWYGDFVATISESLIDNLIRGDLNTDFLDKRTISLNLFDTGSWSYRNAFLMGAEWTYLTGEWGRDSVFLPLAENLLQSKFRLYNVARQKIAMSYHSYDANDFQPLLLWRDAKQSNKTFALCSDIHYPERDTHEVELWEYDNTTVINLI
ncbi:MAG: hypothetical protein KAS32_03950, partial [Candidatus Peribacteraceae bacterium]|nr:hypothetical protein [Candidatus Peribacteraceae bacterium]